jgi:hypothetical protein
MNQNSSKMLSFTRETLCLSPDAPGKPYRQRSKSEKLAVHWGQRKLLLTEITFLTQMWPRQSLPQPIVVYAGAAPGLHLPLLSSLFPAMTFHLYDPAPFGLTATSHLHLYQRKFTDDDARAWARRSDILFISDIRTADHMVMSAEQNEASIIQDLRMQETWYHLIQPVAALLKFRLPYPTTQQPPCDPKTETETFRYLDGCLLKQVWSPQMTTETRLIPNGNTRDYNLMTYESQMFYHNTEIRERHQFSNPLTHTHQPIDPPELENDFDSVAEAWILHEYLQTIKPVVHPQDVIDLSRRLTREMNSQRVTLASLRTSELKSTTKRAASKQSHRGSVRDDTTRPQSSSARH